MIFFFILRFRIIKEAIADAAIFWLCTSKIDTSTQEVAFNQDFKWNIRVVELTNSSPSKMIIIDQTKATKSYKGISVLYIVM